MRVSSTAIAATMRMTPSCPDSEAVVASPPSGCTTAATFRAYSSAETPGFVSTRKVLGSADLKSPLSAWTSSRLPPWQT
ncbi:hypothetical protein ACIQXA_35945 [Streptomyces massasporeus]|uniref:hypothetical protein n=1 Tax=Streptomyces massasporeus TaxID=67324 RepID=UPI0037FF99F2